MFVAVYIVDSINQNLRKCWICKNVIFRKLKNQR